MKTTILSSFLFGIILVLSSCKTNLLNSKQLMQMFSETRLPVDGRGK